MTITIIGLKNCDNCRKAKKAIEGSRLRDLRDKPLSKDELTGFYARFGEDLLNHRSTTWRGLSDEERRREPLDLLEIYPTLIKRPLIYDGGKATLGWSKEVQSEWGV